MQGGRECREGVSTRVWPLYLRTHVCTYCTGTLADTVDADVSALRGIAMLTCCVFM